MLLLEIVTACSVTLAICFGVFFLFWQKRKLAELEADLTRLRTQGIDISKDTLLNGQSPAQKQG
ncbi:hypothetical protein BJI49_03400 [Acetobacter pasteurianus]|uniref:Uncharacterized protein n=1 Tax=Acetobacter pasteurianus TaxID=438 RepID=A0A1A0DP48_ACEPA|nr:hypothetical protein [Acetobacter pasteurianus]OAZ76849.1 hypothetical protein SRCM100623_00074 [Acetobacter pasteurianus]RCL08977.1 hypothetical protein BJI49_03400 [Acetobacter pasteurianus]GAB31053.1 hypothetical protein APS_1655 [Acetobacter pasteurianus subsp. pasteurianus LMG 1262 = NBRC 106471]GCD49983.1 hypothetical protein NBRC106471_1539 [Acetobacter pasteurianus subsp. pasteurianus LMG 1262 = NBRC 106471]